MNELNVLQQVEKFENGDYDSTDVRVQCDAGWYDWFCKDTSLKNKTKTLYGKVKRVLKMNETGKHFEPASVYVFFKNNCPMCGSLYDDFRICDRETGNVLFTVVPRNGYSGVDEDKRGELWGRNVETDSFEQLVEGTWKEILEYFKERAPNTVEIVMD